MAKKALVILGLVALLAAAFWAGTMYTNTTGTAAPGGFAAGDGTMRGGGPMADLTEEEQAALQDMTDEERRTFFQEKMGDNAPAGAPVGIRGGGAIEGEIIEVADDTLTVKTDNGSSQTIYTDEDTVIGYAEGSPALAAGSQVLVVATPEADGVMSATGILVKP